MLRLRLHEKTYKNIEKPCTLHEYDDSANFLYLFCWLDVVWYLVLQRKHII